MTAQEWLSWYPNPLPELIDSLDVINLPEWPGALLEPELSAELNYWLCQWLAACFNELDLLDASVDHAMRSGWPEYFLRWQAESFRQLVACGLAEQTGDSWQLIGDVVSLATLRQQWHDAGFRARCPETFSAQMQLLEACVWALPDILMGRRKATDVLFPNSSMALVEGIYKGNRLADGYNQIVQDRILAYLHKRLSLEPNAQFRLLEIGAGTGGTSAGLFKRLKPLQNHIAEYCYTDLSKAFLIHAEHHYATDAPYLCTALFDVGKSPSEQGLATNAYDVVIAANVLHATPSIKPTLRHAKQLLRNRGVLVLNEISANSLMAHLTFGLLAGWWLYKDDALRIPGSPGLAPEVWQDVLLNEGFNRVVFPAPDWHSLGQQIILAQSDGRVRLTQAIAKPITPSTPEAKAVAVTPVITELNPRTALLAWLSQAVGSCLKMSVEKIHAGKALESYGLDSILVVQLTNQLHKHFHGVTSTLFFEVATLNGLADYLLHHYHAQVLALLRLNPNELPSDKPLTLKLKSAPSKKPVHSPIAGSFDVAVIGLSGRYPKANTLDEFWQVLINGENAISEIPTGRWDWRDGFGYSRWGGFIDGVDEFDPLFFHISPRDAERMDPQERLFLQTAYACIEDAGYTPAALSAQRKVGVFVGVMNSLYAARASHWSIANRVSYCLDFQGPSLAVDTACSSSLTAIHLALNSLAMAESEVALAGGVNLILDPSHYVLLSEMTMISHSAQCRAFGANADGFVDGEGVGAVLLKPLAQAIADDDRIYGVIKASAVNAGGKSNGFTVPNPSAQAQLIAEALTRAKIHPRAISYLEAHGTGTALGDPIEISALTKAFQQSAADSIVETGYCAIGSVKSNIGHSESAAGMAGLTKVLLQLQHQQLVPSLHSAQLNPAINFANTPFVVQQRVQAWQRPVLSHNGVLTEHTRIAGISSFGAGGANAHLIIEEYRDTRSRPVYPQQAALIVLSAKTELALRQQAQNLLEQVRQYELLDIAFTLQVGRVPMMYRLAVIADSGDELSAKLNAFISGKHFDGYRGVVKAEEIEPERFVFTDEVANLYQQIAKAWTQGVEIDWLQLYRGFKPKKLSLPSYPFAKNRYWQTLRVTQPTRVADAVATDWDGYSYQLRWQEHTLTEQAPSPSKQPVLIVVSGERGIALAQALSQYYQQQGLIAEYWRIVDLVTQPNDISYQDNSGWQRCFQRLNLPATVYFISAPNSAALSGASVISQIHQQALQLLRLLAALRPLLTPDSRVTLTLITSDTQAWASEPINPYGAGLTGLAYALAQSEHRIQVRNLDIASALLTQPAALLPRLLAEPATARGEVVKLMANARYQQQFDRLCTQALPSALRRNGVYVILGGAGTIGQALSLSLIEQYQAQPVWLGRTPVEAETLAQKLAAFTKTGIMPAYYQADATDLAQLRQVIQTIQQRFGKIHGAIFAGLVIQFQQPLAALSEDAFWQTLKVKALGSLNFYHALAEQSLDFLCYFSSGQAYAFSGAASLPAYAAGISQADSLVRALSVNAPFPVGIINWGFWQDSAKAVVNAGEVGALSREAGFACFQRFISQLTQQGLPQILCLNASAAVLALMPGAEKNVKALTPSATARITPDTPENEARFKGLVKTSLSEALKLAYDDIDNNTAFSDYGMDSVVAVGFVKRIAGALSCELSTALIYDYTTVNRLTDYLLRHHHESAPTKVGYRIAYPGKWAKKIKSRLRNALPSIKSASLYSATDIAIIGMAGQFPGASDINQFWQNLMNGVDGLSLSAQQTGLAGLLAERHCFDALFFNISPREAEAMSPQQRLVLEQAWLALEDASINPKTLTDTRTGIFIGAEPSHFVGESFTGASDAIIASRLAYFLDLKGPALVVNTGCSSSAVALHLACQSLINQESELALAGGIFVGLTSDMLKTLSDIDMLSASGSCKSFDADADGTAFAEGVAVVVLKRLTQAVADGDPIYAVMQASMMNQDGASNGMTAPNGLAQQALLTELYKTKHIQPEQLSYIETHGTGTRLGDPVEANALIRTFKSFTDKTGFCALGSAKAHIGHTSAAAGVIGLIKLVLSMQKQTLPGLLHFKRLNPLINLTDSAFYIPERAAAWPKPLTGIRRAGLSSFGHSGTNVHFVLADFVADDRVNCNVRQDMGDELNSSEQYAIVLSAKTPERLRAYAEKLLAFIASYSGELADLAYTLQIGREPMTYRLGFCVVSLNQCQSVLSDYLAGQGEGQDWFQAKAPREALVLTPVLQLSTQPLAQWLSLWLQGYAIEWQAYYSSEKPKRIHAPVYPFTRDDYGWQSTPATKPMPMPLAGMSSASQPSWGELTYIWQWQAQAQRSEPVNTKGSVLVIAPLAEPAWLNLLQQHLAGQSVTLITELMPTLNIPQDIATVYFFAPLSPIEELAAEKLLLRLIHALKTMLSVQHVIDFYLLTLDCFPLFERDVQANASGLTGLAYALAQSDYRFKVRNIDLSADELVDSNKLSALLTMIQQEPASDRGEKIKLAQGWRYVQQFNRVAWNNTVSALKTGGVYVILGGAGSVGSVITRYLLAEYQATVIWLGRKPFNDSVVQQKLTLLNHHSLHYYQADANDLASMTTVVHDLKQRFGQINGAIFSGLVFANERPLAELSEAELVDVCAIKTTGSHNFYQAFSNTALDFMCYFSSIQAFAFLSAKDSAAYAAGISYTDSLVHALKSKAQFPVGMINWGYWADTTSGTALEQRLAQHFGLISDEEGWRCFQAFTELLCSHRLSQLLCMNASETVRALIDCLDENIISLAQTQESLLDALWSGSDS